MDQDAMTGTPNLGGSPWNSLARAVGACLAGWTISACSGTQAARPGDAGPDAVAAAAVSPDDGGPPEAGDAQNGAPPEGGVIDDMTRAQPNDAWGWFVFSDRTVMNSIPPVLLPGSPPGFVTPSEGTAGPGFPPGAGNGPILGGVAMNARELTGGGEITWGAGFGLQMRPLISTDGGPLPVNECEAGAVWNIDFVPVPVDASAATGISFYGRSAAGSVSVLVKIGEKRTNLWGGVCDPCAGSGARNGCYDDYQTSVVFTSSWTRYEIHWKDLSTLNYSSQNLPQGGFDPTTFYGLDFILTSDGSFALPNFDILVAYVQYVSD